MARRRLAPFMVFSGTESYDLDQEILQARGSKNRSVVALDGGEVSSSDLVMFCEQPSFMDDRPKLVILDDAGALKDKDGLLDDYISRKASDDLYTILIAVLRPNARGECKVPDLWQKAAAKGFHVVYDKVKSWDTKAKLNRLNKEAGLLGVSLAKGVDETLLKLVEDDLYVQVNELRKLALLVGQHGVVTNEHVRKVVAFQPPALPFEVANAACEKDVKQAMNLVAHLYRYDGDSASIPIVNALMRNVERLLVARSLLDAGKTPDEIAGQMGIKLYSLQKTYLLWCNRHTVAGLKTKLAQLCQLDANVKGAGRSKRTQVELAVLSIAS